ncbi:hypothetical protein KFL_003300120 [Klebsormidium nitens]|uniref:C3H1-type domain-containing protein n=1 Tax=Klebsormidium nitens TaxID=105231 RepID=A0A1Y1IG52_KLENI|nr:hypothetical protein KFL_003300120 [Klebsormidium nitens]|eukprot:GAQ87088.1 hypothetical protein KFL_003300120 [Klebsormidium nitens]
MRFSEQLRGRSIHERLGPQVGFQHNRETGAFHTPPGLPQGARYGHAFNPPQFPPNGGEGPTMFVPTTGGTAPGPQPYGGAPVIAGYDPLQALEQRLQATLTSSIQGGIREYMQAPGHGAPPQTAPPVLIRPEARYGAPPGVAPPAAHFPPQVPGATLGGIPPPPFAPPPAYPVQTALPPAAFYFGGPAPAPPTSAGPFPRTGFDYARLSQVTAPMPTGPRQSTFPGHFVPVQPPKPLLVDDFLTVNAANAQWTTGAPFDILCPMRMAHFAAMAAARVNKPGQPFLETGTGTRRSAGTARGPRGPRYDRCFTWFNTGACANGAACLYVKGHKPCPCGDTRVHAPGACPNNPNRRADGPAANNNPDHAG